MFGFIVDDIIGYAEYVLWNDRIKRVNREYHELYSLSNDHFLICQKCNWSVANCRDDISKSWHKIIYDHRTCDHDYIVRDSNGFKLKLPKNY